MSLISHCDMHSFILAFFVFVCYSSSSAILWYDPQMMRMSFSAESVKSSSTRCRRLWPTSGNSVKGMPRPWPQSHWPPTVSIRLRQHPQPSNRLRLLRIARYSFNRLFIYSARLFWAPTIVSGTTGHWGTAMDKQTKITALWSWVRWYPNKFVEIYFFQDVQRDRGCQDRSGRFCYFVCGA